MDKAKYWEKNGRWFQLPMMVIFVAQLGMFYDYKPHRLMFLQIFDVIGSFMFLWCLWRLYAQYARINHLITTGLYRYTRHPMYLGLLMMNLAYWMRASVWTLPGFLVTEALFIGLMAGAAYHQEQETLARFGAEAQEYYERTPRLLSVVTIRNLATELVRRLWKVAYKVRN